MIDRSSIWAIVPVKSLREGKSRLAHILSEDQRADLVICFLRHHLDVLSQVASLDHILVVSSDATVLATARQQGAAILDEGRVQGLNRATRRAVERATANQATAALILPVDLPLIQVEDVDLMIQSQPTGADSGRPLMAICPDTRRKGTNALFLSLPTHFTFHFGVGSFQRHLHEAARLGLISRIVHAPRLELDIDLEDDWSQYQHMMDQQGRVPGQPVRPQ